VGTINMAQEVIEIIIKEEEIVIIATIDIIKNINKSISKNKKFKISEKNFSAIKRKENVLFF
jgi:hypothetical protein